MRLYVCSQFIRLKLCMRCFIEFVFAIHIVTICTQVYRIFGLYAILPSITDVPILLLKGFLL